MCKQEPAEPMTNPHQHEYRKKPVVIEAFQMTEERRRDNSEWPHWLHAAWNEESGLPGSFYSDTEFPENLFIGTLEGTHSVEYGDWIIRGVQGELYPCKPDIFAATYDKVNGK
jgi:hypothetical protein